MRCLSAGESRTNSVVFFRGLGQLGIVRASRFSRQSGRFVERKPTSLPILRETSSLSPVSTLTAIPCFCRAAIAGPAVSLGGSRNAM